MSDESPAEAPPETTPTPRTVSKLEMLTRAAEVATLVNRGLSYRATASKLGITLGQVQSVVRIIKREAKELLDGAIEGSRQRMLLKNAEVQRELWESLARAREGKVTRTIRGTGDSAVTEITQTSVPETEAKILMAIIKAQEAESLILGVIDRKGGEAQQVNQTVNDNRTILVMNDAELDSSVPWLSSIPRGVGVQGKGLLPKGDPPVEAEVVKP